MHVCRSFYDPPADGVSEGITRVWFGHEEKHYVALLVTDPLSGVLSTQWLFLANCEGITQRLITEAEFGKLPDTLLPTIDAYVADLRRGLESYRDYWFEVAEAAYEDQLVDTRAEAEGEKLLSIWVARQPL